MAKPGIRMNHIGNGWTEALCATVNYKADFAATEHRNFDGSNHNDWLYGFGDSDTLSGRGRNAILQGGCGNDTTTGGAGQDIFMFETPGPIALISSPMRRRPTIR